MSKKTGGIGSRYARVKVGGGKMPKRQRALPDQYYSKGHTHGCGRCNAFIRMCSCTTPEEDPLCSLCELGRDLPWWPESTLPMDCCRYHSKVLDKETKKRFLLAGKREWWGCQECGRKFGYDPSDPENDPPINTEQWLARFGPPLPKPHWSHIKEDTHGVPREGSEQHEAPAHGRGEGPDVRGRPGAG